MAERIVALVGAVLILIGGALDLAGAVDPLPRRVAVDEVTRFIGPVILGVVALLAALIMFRGRYKPGGTIAIAVGVGLALAGWNLSAGVLIAVGGVLGYVAQSS